MFYMEGIDFLRYTWRPANALLRMGKYRLLIAKNQTYLNTLVVIEHSSSRSSSIE